MRMKILAACAAFLCAMHIHAGDAKAASLLIQKGGFIRFIGAELPDASLKMGDKTTVTLRFRNDGPAEPERDYVLSLCLANEHGRDIRCEEQAATLAASPWPGGEVKEIVVPFEVPTERPKGTEGVQIGVTIAEGWHHFLFSLTDEETGAKLILEDGRQPFHQKQNYEAARVYISNEDFLVRFLRVENEDGALSIEVGVQNDSRLERGVHLGVSIEDRAGKRIWRGQAGLDMKQKRNRRVAFKPDIPAQAGQLAVKAELYAGSRIISRAEREIDFAGRFRWTAEKSSRVVEKNRRPAVSVKVSVTNDATAPSEFLVRIGSMEARTNAVAPGGTAEVELFPSPIVGSWSLEIQRSASGSPTPSEIAHQALIATTMETEGTRLALNGEPFIVKGTNVHSLAGSSRSDTRASMQILKDAGYNTLRNDHPYFWQIKLARDLNLFYLPLAPFSVTDTDEIKSRCGNCEGTEVMEALTREFILMFRDFDNVPFWNSANETKLDIDEMLAAVYPYYKKLDPYLRPVVYSNLNSQGSVAGQDFIGFNFYVGNLMHTMWVDDIFDGYAQKANEQNKPVIFTELNSWWGPNQWSGEMVYDAYWDKILALGYSGGIFYQAMDDDDRHPGVFDSASLNNVHLPLYRTSMRHFEDVRLMSYEWTGKNKLTLTLQNRRPFEVRIENIAAEADGQSIAIDTEPFAISPNADAKSTLLLNESGIGPIEIVLSLDTHAGLKAEQRLIVETQPAGSDSYSVDLKSDYNERDFSPAKILR